MTFFHRDHVLKKIASGPYESLTKSTGSFTEDGKTYHGCVIRLSGDKNKVKDTQRPYVPSPQYEVVVKCAKIKTVGRK